MKDKFFEKKLQLIFFFISVGVFLFLSSYIHGGQTFLNSCTGSCDFNLREGFLRPLYSGLKWLSLITLALIFVSETTFKKWLLYIASPVVLMTLLFVGNISVYSDGVIKLSRTDMAQLCMQGLAVITVLFLLIQKYQHKKQ